MTTFMARTSRQINAGVLFFINEVEISIYRFLTSRAKKPKRGLDRSSWGSTGSLAVQALMLGR